VPAEKGAAEGIAPQTGREVVKLLGEVAREAADELIRWAAVKALGDSGVAGAASWLARAAADKDPRVRVEAIGALTRRKDERAGRLALDCALTDPWSWARLECFRDLAALCPRGGGKHLAAAIETKTGPSVRVILHAMASCRYPETEPLLEKMLKAHEKKPLRAGFAAKLLGEMAAVEHAELMAALAEKLGPHAPTRSRRENLVVNLLQGLAELAGAPKGLDEASEKRIGRLALELVAKSLSPNVKVEAIRLLSELCPAEAPRTLRSLVETGSGVVRREAARALRRCPRR
jgi:HEAT repeat protein